MSEKIGNAITDQVGKKGIVETRRLLDRLQTAGLLGVSTATLDRAVRKREISYRRIGDRPMFTIEDIEEYLESRKRPALEKRGRQ